MEETGSSPVGHESHTITLDLYDDKGKPLTIKDTEEPILLTLPRNMEYVDIPEQNSSGN